MTQENKTLKGGKFVNRYLIKAVLTAQTPFHIGDGTQVEREGMFDEKTSAKYQINAAATDGSGKAYITGSSLRGALRDWLRQSCDKTFETLETKSVKIEIDKIKASQPDQDQRDIEIAKFLKDHSSALERIFGTQQNEGKLEVWDAYCVTSVTTETDKYGQLCFWDQNRMTFVAKSVAINPETGTADEGKLYNYELVPANTSFAVAFSAQNLSFEESALLMAILNGFNDPHKPITIGAMTKLDYGRFRIDQFKIYRVDKNNNIGEWKKKAGNTSDSRAGYELIADDDFKVNKAEYDDLLKAKIPDAKPVDKLVVQWTLNLEAPLVIRSGTAAGWKNTPGQKGRKLKKARNYNMEFMWDVRESKDYDEINDLYHSIAIEGAEVKPYYHVPSSSIRGALRGWAIEHLLPVDWWNIESKLKEGDDNTPQYFDQILSLFGFAVEGADKNITEKYTKAGRLTIRVAPFTEDAHRPVVDGNWTASNDFGPAKARRHIKPRNPLDRITQAAKEGGLHNSLEFSKNQKLIMTIEINNPNKFDRKLLARWESEIAEGQILLGGLTGIGRGRVKLDESKVMFGEVATNE